MSDYFYSLEMLVSLGVWKGTAGRHLTVSDWLRSKIANEENQ